MTVVPAPKTVREEKKVRIRQSLKKDLVKKESKRSTTLTK